MEQLLRAKMTTDGLMMPLYIFQGNITFRVRVSPDRVVYAPGIGGASVAAATVPRGDASLRWSEGESVPTVCGTRVDGG